MLASISVEALVGLKIREADLPDFIKEIKENPQILYLKLGNSFFNNNLIEESAELYRKAIDTNSNFAPAYHNLGIAYYKQKRYNKAIEQFGKAIEANKSYAKAYSSLAVLYFELGGYGNAITHFQILTKLEPDNAGAHFDLAQSYVAGFRSDEKQEKENLGYLKQALFHLKKTVEIEPDFPNALTNMRVIEKVIKEMS